MERLGEKMWIEYKIKGKHLSLSHASVFSGGVSLHELVSKHKPSLPRA